MGNPEASHTTWGYGPNSPTNASSRKNSPTVKNNGPANDMMSTKSFMTGLKPILNNRRQSHDGIAKLRNN